MIKLDQTLYPIFPQTIIHVTGRLTHPVMNELTLPLNTHDACQLTDRLISLLTTVNNRTSAAHRHR